MCGRPGKCGGGDQASVWGPGKCRGRQVLGDQTSVGEPDTCRGDQASVVGDQASVVGDQASVGDQARVGGPGKF